MTRLDQRWFKEDRQIKDKVEREKAIEESDKAIRNSTLIRRRLKQIIEDEIAHTYRSDEQIEEPNWERIALANVATRKALNNLIKLLD